MLKGVLQFGLTRRPIILLFLLVFIGGGLIAFTRLNIEAYPNPAPVILEITAQAAGLSAEEMERYYTIPMEVGLAATPGVDNIRSTSFYGLSFVRVTFNYGVDYYFALTQAAISLQQNVNLPNNVTPQIQGSSLVGEIYRYQVVGPPHIGLDQSSHHPGLGPAAPAFDRPGRRPGQHLGRHYQGIRGRGRSQQARCLQRHLAPGDQCDRQRQYQCGRPHHQFRPAIGQHPRHRSVERRRRFRFDPGLPGRRHRENRAGAIERRAGDGQGRRQGLCRLHAAARQGRPRQRRRCGRGHRGDEPDVAHQRRGGAHQDRGR